MYVFAIIGIVVIVGLAYVYGPQTSDNSGDEAVEPGPNTIIMSHDKFNPNNITVKAGSTVTWINKDWYIYYTIISDSPNATYQSTLLKNGDSFTYTFTTPGIYSYHSKGKPDIKGTVTVQS